LAVTKEAGYSDGRFSLDASQLTKAFKRQIKADITTRHGGLSRLKPRPVITEIA
jgi:hypothetical protein